MRGRHRLTAAVAAIALVLTTGTALADIPRKINYQALLLDAETRTPLSGAHTVTFRIYDSESEGAELWSEVQAVTVDSAGVAAVILGTEHPIDIAFDGPTWLQVEVDGEVLSPRRQMVSVPYAFDAASVGGIAANASPTANTLYPLGPDSKFPMSVLPPGLPPGDHASTHNSGGEDQIAVTSDLVVDGTLQGVDLGGNSVTADKILPNVVSSLDGVANDGGDVDLVPSNSITITGDDASNTITVGETHSARTDNPHATTAAQTGAVVSVDRVSNPGGNINLIPGSNIVITPDNGANSITISASGGSDWSLTGNLGTTPGTNFLGTTDNVPLELKVNSARILRLEPNAFSPNIIGGYNGNSVTSGVRGATISGGGSSGSLNRVTDHYGTVGGGVSNQAGDSAGTAVDGQYATVGGGYSNKATGAASTIGGGQGNDATAYLSTIGGGHSNEAEGGSSTVAGGENNAATGDYSAIPGGNLNTASGQYSFAAGRRAKANHSGSFVWGDNTAADVASTAANQFVVRANGGVHFRDSQEMRMSDNAAVTLVLEADTDNVNEDHNAGILLSQDGGAVEGFLGYGAGTNRLLLENRYTDRLELKSSGGIHLYTNDTQTKGMRLSDDCTVGGGDSNEATGNCATVPGGRNNSALGDYSFAAGRNATAEDNGTFVWADASENNIIVVGENRFVVRASGGVSLYTNSTFSTGMYLAAGGSGWVAVSDRNMKTNIRPVDVKEVLNRLSRVPISQWSYKTQAPSIEHIGPMAQDFHQAFGLGEDEKGINTIDTDGVALAAIQGLYEIVKEKDVKIVAQQQRIDSQQEQITVLEARLAALEARMK